MTINLSLKGVLIVLCCVLAIACGSMAYFHFKTPVTVNTETYTPAPEIKETVKIKRVEVPGPEKIITIEKEKVVERLKLPDDIGKNPDKQIVATAVVEPYEGKTNAVAVMDTKTGEGSISVKQEPLPTFAFKNEKAIGGRAGYVSDKDGIRQQVDFYGHYTFLRVWRVHVGVYGEVNSRPEGKTAVDISYRW
jgi:hypothetical protein